MDNDSTNEVEAWRRKRAMRRRQGQEQERPTQKLRVESEDDFEHIALTAAKRRRLEREQLLKERKNGKNLKDETNFNAAQVPDDSKSEPNNDQTEAAKPKDGGVDETSQPLAVEEPSRPALIDQEENSNVDREERQRQAEEEILLKHARQAIQTSSALQTAKQVAEGIVYKKPMPSTWRVPRYLIQQGPGKWQQTRQENHIDVQGGHVPPPLTRFVDMKLPPPILSVLKNKNIHKPTPIQMQGIPVALAGRDMVGIAFTGSGKTLAFSLPLVMAALEEELRMPLKPGEGPVGIVLAPSRELARQTHDIVNDFCRSFDGITKNKMTSLLLIGGEPIGAQRKVLENEPVHCVVATAGRLRMLLKQHTMSLDICRFICLDEADRLLDLGFDEEIGDIMNFFKQQKQTLLFSATFPQKFQDFCRQTLVLPCIVNVGRAGAASLDVIQEVEYVKNDARLVYLLHCLQKTAPPVCIFSQRQREVDDIHEYLLVKGVQAASIHGGKDQQERNAAIQSFKSGEKDVLIATDVAAKGLDFPNIQHVINFDMPQEIENYVHRIGRTGRNNKTGVATTFINKSCDERILLDLKALLQEAGQRIPPVLEMLQPANPTSGSLLAASSGPQGTTGCSFCGGLGHTIVDCPKLEKDAKRIQRSHHDALQMGGGDW